jgi:hypothetical protein
MSVRDSSDASLSRYERWPGIFGLAYGFVGAPLTALWLQSAAYNGVHWACGHDKNIGPVHILPALSTLIAIGALWVSWRDWTNVGRITQAEGATVSDRTRFLSLGGLLLSSYGLLLILAMWVPLLVFDPCQH